MVNDEGGESDDVVMAGDVDDEVFVERRGNGFTATSLSPAITASASEGTINDNKVLRVHCGKDKSEVGSGSDPLGDGIVTGGLGAPAAHQRRGIV